MLPDGMETVQLMQFLSGDCVRHDGLVEQTHQWVGAEAFVVAQRGVGCG